MIRPRPQAAPLIGRGGELRTIRGFFLRRGTRLLTLTGAPGSGKSRLALAAAARLEGGFERGVCFVDLAPVSDPEAVAPCVVRALGIADTASPPIRVLITSVRDSDLLLVLDNFEHVLAARTDVAELLTDCPRLKVMVTSRQALDIRLEQELPIPPLPLPDLQRLPARTELGRVPSVALFVERARAVHPAFRLTDANGPAVAEICVRVDGLPLAIELAARRVKYFSVQEIAHQLTLGYAILAEGPRDVAREQRSLDAAIARSHDLLGDAARVGLRRLAVFAGGATLEAAGEVCGIGAEIAEALASLTDSGLVYRVEAPPARSRFRMLETIRDFAARRLAEAGEEDEVRLRHLEYFARLAERAHPRLGFFLSDREMQTMSAILEPESEEIVSALMWAARHDAAREAGLRLAVNLHWFWFLRGRFADVRAGLDALLRQSDGVDERLRALASTTAAFLACWQGDFHAALPHAEQGLEEFRRLGDSGGIAFALHAEGFAALGLGDRARAHAQVAEALAIARQAHDDWLVAFAVSFLGVRIEYDGDLDEARRMHEECIAIVRRLGGHGQGEGYSLFHLGRIARLQGDLRSARLHLADALEHFRALGDPRGMVYCLLGLAVVAIEEGQAVQAAGLLGALEGARLRIGPILERQLEADYTGALHRVRTALGDDAFTRVWTQGRTQSLEQAAAEGIRAPAPPAKALGRRTPLTSREEQVAALVAQGLTNRQIAKTLVIGTKTADTHVQHIMDKLGLHSRAQIAAWAAEQHLIPFRGT